MRALIWIVSLSVLAAVGLRAEIDRKAEEADAKNAKPEVGGSGHDGDGHGEEGSDAEHEAIHRKLEEDSRAALRKIQELMEKTRDQLAKKDTGRSTQTDQQETIKKIQELLDQTGKG